jgi:predicted histidine transporter YuiF (NhaC family)
MFNNPHMMHMIAKQKHEELLAEIEQIQKLKSLSKNAKKKNRRMGRMILPIADLFIAIGVGLKRRYGS